MSDIPKRPQQPLGMQWSAHHAHEHAVAKRAVGALRAIEAGRVSASESEAQGFDAITCAGSAIAEIEASGWKP